MANLHVSGLPIELLDLVRYRLLLLRHDVLEKKEADHECCF